jgi:hypothetical protein
MHALLHAGIIGRYWLQSLACSLSRSGNHNIGKRNTGCLNAARLSPLSMPYTLEERCQPL